MTVGRRTCLRCQVAEYFDDSNTFCPLCDAETTSINGRTGLRDQTMYDRVLAYRRKEQAKLLELLVKEGLA